MPPGSYHLLELLQPGQAVELCSPPPTLLREGQVQGRWGEERCSQDGDGAPPGCDVGVECPLVGCSATDRVSSHPAAELGRHHPRVLEDGRRSGQRPLCIRHGHLVGHLHHPRFRRGISRGQSRPHRILHLLVATLSRKIKVVSSC
jgi:hypothetical protein